jgi:hypothetical protein
VLGDGVAQLVAHLAGTYGADHPVIVYEAATHPLGRARVERLLLRDLDASTVTPASTLLVVARPS